MNLRDIPSFVNILKTKFILEILSLTLKSHLYWIYDFFSLGHDMWSN